MFHLQNTDDGLRTLVYDGKLEYDWVYTNIAAEFREVRQASKLAFLDPALNSFTIYLIFCPIRFETFLETWVKGLDTFVRSSPSQQNAKSYRVP